MGRMFRLAAFAAISCLSAVTAGCHDDGERDLVAEWQCNNDLLDTTGFSDLELQYDCCSNGRDDDGNGFTDGDDPFCREVIEEYEDFYGDGSSDTGNNNPNNTLTPEECSDGLDNDNDGLVDCADPNCDCYDNGSSNYGPENDDATCSDGIDNDGDGLTDCADPGCDCHDNGGSNYGEQICNDGTDNDNDGQVDVADNDCYDREVASVTVLADSYNCASVRFVAITAQGVELDQSYNPCNEADGLVSLGFGINGEDAYARIFVKSDSIEVRADNHGAIIWDPTQVSSANLSNWIAPSVAGWQIDPFRNYAATPGDHDGWWVVYVAGSTHAMQ